MLLPVGLTWCMNLVCCRNRSTAWPQLLCVFRRQLAATAPCLAPLQSCSPTAHESALVLNTPGAAASPQQSSHAVMAAAVPSRHVSEHSVPLCSCKVCCLRPWLFKLC